MKLSDKRSSKLTMTFALLLMIFSVLLHSPATSYAISQVDTKYFTIIYDENGEYTAGKISQFCDEIYEELMGLFDAFTDDPRVVCIVNDAVDIANGYAIYYQNTITIYATSMDLELRGQSDWLKNVFVHEMTHMIALKKAAKGPINYFLLGAGRFNRNPDASAMLAISHISQPSWFSEGTAQVGAERFGSEKWDTHRDMLLRTAWYEDKLLSLDDMSVLTGQSSMEGEAVYNQGYSLVSFVRDHYGIDKVVRLNNECAFYDFEVTIKNVLGISADTLYKNWHESLEQRYKIYREKSYEASEPVADIGSHDFFPSVSPDGRFLAWIANKNQDYTITDLMLKDLTTGKIKKIVARADKRPSWSHDSKKIVYAKRPPRRQNFYDLYIYDIESGTERRISRQMRATDPSFSPDDSKIVFVRNEAGNNTLSVMNANGSGLGYISTTHDGTQFYRPSFSPDGKTILFSLYRQGLDRDIATIDADAASYRYEWDRADSTSAFSDTTSFGENSGLELLIATDSDDRDPVFLPDSSGIVYSSDRKGVYNLYKYDFASKTHTRLTDLIGGAFSPTVSNSNDIYYAAYKSQDFSIYTTTASHSLDSAELPLELRNYFTQPDQFSLSKYLSPSPARSKRILNAIIPTLYLGPSFIGSRFGLNVFNIGTEAYVSDLLGRDSFAISGSVGKNLTEEAPLNNDVEILYQKRLAPITSNSYNHSPTLYVNAGRSVIHNHIDQYKGFVDSSYIADMPEYGYDNVLQDLRQYFEVADKYRHEFRRFNIGFRMPLAPKQSFGVDAGFRSYFDSIQRSQYFRDYSNFITASGSITDQIDNAGAAYTVDTKYYTDLEYYRSGDIAFTYNYYDIKPQADSDVSPRGTAAFLRYRYMRTEHADSLVSQVALAVPLGMLQDGSFQIQSYIPDEYQDEYRPLKRRDDVNEYFLFFQHFQALPFFRHTIGASILSAYHDIQLKDSRKNEGVGYNWPLKFYLGGSSMLSGYPYFAFWGSKIFYSRFDYTFPIRRKIAKSFMGTHFQRLYGNVFFEAGKVWNFEKMSTDNLRKGSFKRDVGFEMRLKMVSFYRLSMYMTLKVAWPLDDMNDSPYRDQRDARRFYFGLRM